MAESKSEDDPAISKRKSDSITDSPNKSLKLDSKEIDPSVVAQEEQEQEEDEDFGSEDEETNGDEKMADRKGKGKMIVDEEEEEEEEEDDDSSGGESGFDSEGELSDDPLTEVDLNNILPCRTRRRQVQPGVYIANDLPDDSSDDSDA